jgi:Activator of Hsp90 ATPase homolog 1-like protein
MVRRLGAPPSRVYRAWTVPEELIRWFPQRVEGSLAVGTRSTLVFPGQRVWWDVTVVESDRALRVPLAVGPRRGLGDDGLGAPEAGRHGTRLTLTDGPFDLRVPNVLDAYAEALEG